MSRDGRSLSPQGRGSFDKPWSLSRNSTQPNYANLSPQRGSSRTPVSPLPVSSMHGVTSSNNHGAFAPPMATDATLPDSSEGPSAYDIYRRNWIRVILGSTSGLMYTIVLLVLYALANLCSPYANSVSFGMLLSVILHPRNREENTVYRTNCIERMRGMQQEWAQVSTISGIIGSILSLRHFVAYALMQIVPLLGLHKLCISFDEHQHGCNGSDKKKIGKSSLASTTGGRRILRALALSIILFVAHMLIGASFFLGMHMILFIIFAISVPLMPEKKFVGTMWFLWRTALIFFFVIAITYNLALDILSISDAVKRTTSAVVNAQREWSGESSHDELLPTLVDNTSIKNKTRVKPHIKGNESNPHQLQSFLLSKVQQTVLKELEDILDQTNATELAVAVRQGFAPMLSTLSEDFSFSMFLRKSGELYRSLFSKQQGSPNWVGLAQKLMERWQPFLTIGTKALILVGSNMMGFFDSIYAFMLFVFVFRYFTSLDHTLLYYAVAKMLKVIHPQFGERHARNIEQEITTSFFSLLQSFWHITWFHFCITFCLFKMWSLATPFLFGMVSSLTAIFPLIPKWLSPVAFALTYSIFEAFSGDGFLGVVLSFQVWWCLAAFVLSYADEWLLSVSRGIRGESVRNAAGVKREQLPTFVVGTALVLGYVSYGVRGILIGPMTVIVAKVIFDNWDIIFERESTPVQKSVSFEKCVSFSDTEGSRSALRAR